MCYLDGEEGGACVTFAAELGFVKVDQFEIDLTLGGLEGVYTHVAMVREPNTTKVEVKVEEGKGGE